MTEPGVDTRRASAGDRAPARRVSLWAVASLVCSALACPPLCAIGPLLGLVGLRQTRPGGGYSGRRLAVAGIVVGLAACVGWGVAGAWWHANVRRPVLEGPRDALAAGLDGDAGVFAAAFAGAPDERAASVFLAEARLRYGSLRSITPDPGASATRTRDFDARRLELVYLVRFDRAALRADATFVRRPGVAIRYAWGTLAIRDPERGDLVYPPPDRPADGPAGSTPPPDER